MNKPLPQEGWPNFGLVHTRKWRGWWKVGTVVATSIAAYALVFHVEFKQEEHVFSGLRRWHSRTVDRLFGLDRRTPPKQIENAAPVAAARQQD